MKLTITAKKNIEPDCEKFHDFRNLGLESEFISGKPVMEDM